MNFRYQWPAEKPVYIENVFGSGVDLLKEKFGALSQDPDSIYSRICVGNSVLSIEPYRGCPLGCAYCMANNDVRSLRMTENVYDYSSAIIKKPEKIFDARILVEGLIRHPAFLPNRSILGFCTGSSEFFLPELKENLWDGIQTLIEHDLHNPIWIVAKSFLSKGSEKEWLRFFEKLDNHGIRVILSISYAGLPAEIEPYSKNRFKDFLFLRDSPVIVSHHMRPMLPDTEHTEQVIKRLVHEGNGFVQSICVGGLRIDPGMQIFWKNEKIRGIQTVPGSQIKHFDTSIKTRIMEELKIIDSQIPVFTQSSRMIAWHLNIRDFNLYDFRQDDAFLTIDDDTVQAIERKCGKNICLYLQEIAMSIGLYVKFVKHECHIQVEPSLSYTEERALLHAIGHTGVF